MEAPITSLVGRRCSFPTAEVTSRVALEITKWAVSAAILLEFFDVMRVVRILESSGGSICHHQEARCFDGANGPWVVCARCSGMYFGWMGTMVLAPILQSRLVHSRCLRFVTSLFLFAVISALLERCGVFASSNSARAILGIPLGIFPSLTILYVTDRLKDASPSTLPRT
jgi:uncharacterized membrane protein